MGSAEIFNSEKLGYRDPLCELKKDAQKIAGLASQRNLQIKISVLGAFHEGVPDAKTLETIANSDIVSVELPSVAVKAYLKDAAVKVDKDSFWGRVLENAKEVEGVNNNKAAVNAIRILDGRVRAVQRVPDSSPDIVISAKNMKFGSGEALEKTEIADLETLQEIRKQEIEFSGTYPSLVSVTKEGVEHFIYVVRPTQGKKVLSAALISGDFMLPVEYFMMHGSEIFGDEIAGIAGVDLCKFALTHLLRTRVDKGQVKGMLNKLSAIVKKSLPDKTIAMIHVGGVDHKPNLLRILSEVFKLQNNIQISEAKDCLIPKLFSSESVFFDENIAITDALLTTRAYADQIVVDVPYADRLLKEIFSRKKELMIVYYNNFLNFRNR